MSSGFADPWNPTLCEVRRWAFEQDAMFPEQDWDLALLWCGFASECLRLAADETCPNRDFFIHMLYLHVGDAIRSDFSSASRVEVDKLLSAALNHAVQGELAKKL